MRGLLISLSGARPEILERCPTERLKFESLGWAIVISSVLATVSIWFGLANAIEMNPVLALPFALVWGLIVMGIERWLVLSMPAYDRRGWAIVVPRLLLTTLLGTLVAIPLTLQIFLPEIDAQIAVINQHAHQQANSGLLIRLQALDQLSGESFTINASRVLLLLLFIVVESLPLITKLLQRRGNYEAILRVAVERELRDARRAFRSSPTVGRYQPPERDLPPEELIQEIWRQRPNNESGWSPPVVAQPFIYQQEGSDEHIRREDEALREMRDIPAVADLDIRGGIALRYDDDDN